MLEKLAKGNAEIGLIKKIMQGLRPIFIFIMPQGFKKKAFPCAEGAIEAERLYTHRGNQALSKSNSRGQPPPCAFTENL